MSLRAVFLGLFALSLACSPGGGGDGSDSGMEMDANDTPDRDADGDGIGDDWEGRADDTDTDGDGTPDYLDTDSDDDGVPDAVEKGNGGGMFPPADSDMDGIYDFREEDADDNGIPDGTEGTIDTDGDTVPDFQDLDNDGDSVPDRDEVGDPASPIDFDGDGLPDHLDTDSDGDTIGDLHEAFADTDMDSIPDRQDLDTDGDGWSDADEAGDGDPATPPVDTDGDEIPDFRDPDSDNDGLSDAAERDLGTARDDADTDGDGVTDLIEIAGCEGDPTCMDATDPDSSPRTRGDFVFFMPFEDTPDPLMDTLDFSTNIQVADVYFLMDTTGSMGSSVASLRSSLASFIPMVRSVIPDVQIGIGDYKDYPVAPYGWVAADGFCGTNDFAYRNYQNVTADDAAAIAAMSAYNACGGNDVPESLIPALWSITTGNPLPGNSGLSSGSSCPADHWGYPCFRPGAVPIVVGITDVPTHSASGGRDAYSDAALGGHAPTFAETIAAMNDANVRFIGIGQGSGGIADMNSIATGTGSVDGAGSPLTSVWSGGAIASTVLTQIQTLASSTPLDISAVFSDDPSDSVDSFAAFVDRLETNEAGDPARGCDARPGTDTDGDGVKETFEGVTPGMRVCFDIHVKQNDTVEPTSEPQVFRATIRVLGDGFTELDSREVFFLVPPEIEIIGPPI